MRPGDGARRQPAPRVPGVRLTYSELRVVECESVTPRMRRVTFTGDGLAGFTPVAPDQQVKLFFARDGGAPEVPDPPAALDDVAGWYQRYLAMPDDRRPSVSHLRTPGRHDWKLFAGDETALPAIGAWLESLGPDDHAVVVAEVAGPAEEQRFDTAASVSVTWLHRDGVPAGRSGALLDAVRELEFPGGEVFAWVAGEASAVREVRRHLVGERGIDRRSVAFAGYWRVRLAQDDAPTPEELDDQVEAVAG